MAEPITIEPGTAPADVLFRDGVSHPQRAICPGCQAKLDTTAVVELAYVLTACDCRRVDYRHLYEQLWHLNCLRLEPQPPVDPARLVDVLSSPALTRRIAQARGRDRFANYSPTLPFGSTLAGRRNARTLAEAIADEYAAVTPVAPTTVGGTDS